MGGVGIETETDVFMIGKTAKDGLGQRFKNKSYVQYFAERNGFILLEIFANPQGGPERLSHIKKVLDENLAYGSILHSDSVRSLKAWVNDNNHLNIMHILINHSEAKLFGFTWYLFVDHEDGEGFEHLTDGDYELIRAGTQHADGYAGSVKMWLNGKRGLTRDNVKGYLKEAQFRTNIGSRDVFDEILTGWGIMETKLRNNEISEAFLTSLLNWKFGDYDSIPEFLPVWECPGCSWSCEGTDWKKQRNSHKNTCVYYNLEPLRQYNHSTSRCSCCIHPYHGNGPKLKATRYDTIIKAIKKKKKNRKLKNKLKLSCVTCGVMITNTAQSRYQHRANYPLCKYYYQQNKN